MRLSIIIVTYKMQREAPRTVASALPPMQREVDGIDYEIIVIDNGAPDPLALIDLPEAGPPVRLIRVAPEAAAPSPVFCVNKAIAEEAAGDLVMICIDGARLFSPYLVRRSVDLLDRFPTAATYVGSRHLGRKVQMQSVLEGYDQREEDVLLTRANWREDTDRLWNISVWAGAHDPKTPILQNESNAVTMARSTWDALGGYREGFARPGGGLCNLELFNRLLARDEGPAISLMGETTFHQVHGGAATSEAAYFGESLAEFKAVTGKDYAWPDPTFLLDAGTAYGRPERTARYYR